jgi:hypothetical protein
MNFGAARLGFWFRPPVIDTGDRSQTKSRNVLIVYDPTEAITAGFNTIYNDGGDPHPSQIAATISARETALGFTPTTVTTYAALAAIPTATLNNYSHIWDIGYNTVISTGATSIYTDYLQNGGALFILGENLLFNFRDGSIASFITSVGGGTVTHDANAPKQMETTTVAPEFRLANSSATVTFDAPGRFLTLGTGTAMTTEKQAAVWKTGSLSNAQTGAIAVVLDINVFTSALDQNFVDNISITLNKK